MKSKTPTTPFMPCLIGAIACLILASIAGWITQANIAGWYNSLQKPVFNPPAFVFGPVWTVLYIMIGISGGLLWHIRKQHAAPFVLFCLQLLLNFSWSFIFFGAHQIGWALIDIIALILAVVATVMTSYRCCKIASVLLWPYLAWILFACILNACIWLLN